MSDKLGVAASVERERLARDLENHLRRCAVAHLTTEAGAEPQILNVTSTGTTRSFEAIVRMPRGARLVRVTVEAVE